MGGHHADSHPPHRRKIRDRARLAGGLLPSRRRPLRDLGRQSRGELPGNADLDLLVDQIYGLLWYRILVGHAPLTADTATQLSRAVAST